MAARDFKNCVYEGDDGEVYLRGTPNAYLLQGGATPKNGAVESTVWHAIMPRSFKPRVAVCEDTATGKRYRIVCFTNDCALYTTKGTTFDIMLREGGTAVTVTQIGTQGERKRIGTLAAGA